MLICFVYIEMRFLFVIIYVFLQVFGSGSKMLCVHFDDAQDGALLEVCSEGLSLFLVA